MDYIYHQGCADMCVLRDPTLETLHGDVKAAITAALFALGLQLITVQLVLQA